MGNIKERDRIKNSVRERKKDRKKERMKERKKKYSGLWERFLYKEKEKEITRDFKKNVFWEIFVYIYIYIYPVGVRRQWAWIIHLQNIWGISYKSMLVLDVWLLLYLFFIGFYNKTQRAYTMQLKIY